MLVDTLADERTEVCLDNRESGETLFDLELKTLLKLNLFCV